MSSQADCDVAENDIVPVSTLITGDTNRLDMKAVELTESNGNAAVGTRQGRTVSFANYPSHPT